MMNKERNGLFQMELLKVFMQLKNNIIDLISPATHKYGLNLLDVLVLFSISKRNDLTIGDVYRSMNLNQGNLSSMCKKMEEKGYLIRSRNKKDQRTVVLEITDRGEETLNNINREFEKLHKIIEEIPQDDIKDSVEGLISFADIIEEIHSKTKERE